MSWGEVLRRNDGGAYVSHCHQRWDSAATFLCPFLSTAARRSLQGSGAPRRIKRPTSPWIFPLLPPLQPSRDVHSLSPLVVGDYVEHEDHHGCRRLARVLATVDDDVVVFYEG